MVESEKVPNIQFNELKEKVEEEAHTLRGLIIDYDNQITRINQKIKEA